MAHKTLIGGTSYDAKSGRTLIGGTGYDIKKGRTLIDGTGYDISFGTPVGELPVGSSVFMNVDGVRTEYIIVHQGNPDPTIYDASCNGTWLLMKDIYEIRKWHTTSLENNLENSTVHSYLNGTFLNLFDANIRDAIKQVKIPYRKGVGNGGTDQSGANGLSCKAFLLSGYELGWTTSDSNYFPVDGAKLDYFMSGSTTAADSKRIANYKGSANYWWLRSPNTNGSSKVWYVISSGGYGNNSYVTGQLGIRSTFIFPQNDVFIDDNFNIITP